MLISSEWLTTHINDKELVIVDMSSDYTQYQRFHIPGAVYLDYSMLVQTSREKVSYAIPPQQLQQLLGYLGIQRNSHIVIYDDMGGLNATRLFWQLEQIAHPKVSILNGGLVSWIRQGKSVSGELKEPQKVRYMNTTESISNLASFEDVLSASSTGKSTLVDARSAEEYLGNPIYKRSGHIPGAISYTWDSSVDFQQSFKLKDDTQIANLLTQAGLSTDKNTPIITYCQSGHRASHTYFLLKLQGYKNVKLYDGSFAEYQRKPAAPMNLGAQP